MVNLALKRLASILLFASGWIIAAIRTTLDLIGWSTAPDDVKVAMTRLDQFFAWLLAVPWWIPWGFVLLSTLWLMWVSWPRQAPIGSPLIASPPLARSLLKSQKQTIKPSIFPSHTSNVNEIIAEAFFNSKVQFTTFKLSLGERICPIRDNKDIQVELKSIRNASPAFDFYKNIGAEIYVTNGGGVVNAGTGAIPISVNTYFLSQSIMSNIHDPYSIFACQFSDKYILFFNIYIEHINVHSGIVTFKMCHVRGFDHS